MGGGGKGGGGQENCQRLNHPESYAPLSGNYPFRPNKGVHPRIKKTSFFQTFSKALAICTRVINLQKIQ